MYLLYACPTLECCYLVWFKTLPHSQQDGDDCEGEDDDVDEDDDG